MSGPSHSPRITVVVTAHRRKEFLRSALESVRFQLTEALPVEVVVVKDFVDSSLDGFLRDSGILSLEPTVANLGGWVSEAAEHARAPVLAFLDDDDLFVGGKLAAVDQVFREEPGCGYYRNAVRRFGEVQRTEVSNPDNPSRPFRRIDDASKAPGPIEAMWRAGVSFNHSSIAVRRELVQQFRPELKRLRGGYSTFLFYAALVSTFGVVLDPRPFTLYRIHGGNRSPQAGGPRRREWGRALRQAGPGAHDAELILEMVRRRRPALWTQPVGRVRARNEMYLSWTDPGASRRRRTKALVGLARVDGVRDLLDDLPSLGLGGLAIVRPDLVRRWCSEVSSPEASRDEDEVSVPAAPTISRDH